MAKKKAKKQYEVACKECGAVCGTYHKKLEFICFNCAPPEPEKNVNVLKGIACPSCGYTDHFDIECSGVCEVTDDGVDVSNACTWQPESFIRCGSCGHEGEVCEFSSKPEGTFEGKIDVGPVDLDLLKEQKQALMDAIGDDPADEPLIGLLEFIDHIEDQIYLKRG